MEGSGVNRPLSPAQSEVLAAGLLTSGFNCILQMPTGSGKTWLAEHAIRDALTRGRRAIYLAALRALARELGERWKDLFAPHPVGVFTGEAGAPQSPTFAEARLLVMTPERLDACTRTWRAQWHWIPEVGVIVADELHLLGEPRRGARLEGAILRMLRLNPFARVIGLSATLGNRLELADWLHSTEYASDWRPVPLRWRTITFKKAAEKPGLTAATVAECARSGGRSLVFVQSRRRAEALAQFLREGGLRAEHHHGGLDRSARARVEEGVRSGAIQVVVATSTLEMGVNFPVRQVVLHDLQTFDGEEFRPLPVNSVWQRAGRAGRPGLDPSGEVVLVTPAWLKPRPYEEARFEPIRSRLAEPAELAEQLVAEVASGMSLSTAQLEAALGRSLASHQNRLPPVGRIVGEMLEAGMLVEKEVKVEGKAPRLRATPLGHIAARHLLAPATLLLFKRSIAAPALTFFDLLVVACSSGDCEPVLPVDFEELDSVGGAIEEEPSHVLHLGDADLRSLLQVGGKRALASLKMALVLRALTRLGDVASVAEAHDCYPHEVARLQESVERLLLAFESLVRSMLHGMDPRPQYLVVLLRKVGALRRMVATGLDESAATLTFVPGVGPQMARRLVAAGVRHIEDLALSSPSELRSVRGLSPERAVRWIEAAESIAADHSAASLREDLPGARFASSGIPYDVDPYRLRRALELKVARRGVHFSVSGGLEPHLVALVPAPSCDCADFGKGNTCKHLLAVRLHSGEAQLKMATIALATVSGQIDLQRWWFGLAVPARSFKVAG
jgi:helicase